MGTLSTEPDHCAITTPATPSIPSRYRPSAHRAAVSRNSPRFAADVSDPAAVARLKAAVVAELGAPSVLVNAAGVFGPIALIEESEPAEWIETLMIDAVGPCAAFVARSYSYVRAQNQRMICWASLNLPRLFS
eukprot:SAG11_NODE_5813_length_1458_cov_1.481236_1_plen_133_part_00